MGLGIQGMQFLAVAIGGALGAMGRFAVMSYTFPMQAKHFPVGTLAVNIIGSLLIGVFYVLIVERSTLSAEWRLWIMTGFLGAFTTFSTFALDAILLWMNGQGAIAVMYILSNLAGCLLAAYAGLQLTLRFI